MSASQFEEFERRMRRINRRHTKLSHGYRTAVTDDGLVVAKPARRGSRAMMRGTVVVLMTILAFKAFLLAQLGAAAYIERVERLSTGTVVEQAGAWIMYPDPATIWLADRFVSLVR